MRLKSVGVIGEVVLWNLSNDVNCMEFVGHEGSVVGISVPSFTSASAARTHTLAPDGSLVSVAHAADAGPKVATIPGVKTSFMLEDIFSKRGYFVPQS